jgi:hypothetical protein
MLAMHLTPVVSERVEGSRNVLNVKVELLKVQPPTNELRQGRLMQPKQVAVISLQAELNTKE